MVARLAALIALLLAAPAHAIDPERLWGVQSLTLSWEPASGPVTEYLLLRQDDSEAPNVQAPWLVMTRTTATTATVSLPRCRSVRYSIEAIDAGTQASRSDPAQWIAWCGNPDLNNNKAVDLNDFGAFRRAYGRRRVGAELVP